MNVFNFTIKPFPLFILGLVAGLLISTVDNFAFEGEVSPIVIVVLLFLSTAAVGAGFGRKGLFASVSAWVIIPLAHLIKHVLNLPDTINPNTYLSILKLAIFTFFIAAIGFGTGTMFYNLNKVTKNDISK